MIQVLRLGSSTTSIDMVDDVEDMDFPGGYGFFYLDDEEDMDFSS